MSNGFVSRVLVVLIGGLLVAATTGIWKMSAEFAAMRQELTDIKETVHRGLAYVETRMNRIEARIDDRVQASERATR